MNNSRYLRYLKTWFAVFFFLGALTACNSSSDNASSASGNTSSLVPSSSSSISSSKSSSSDVSSPSSSSSSSKSTCPTQTAGNGYCLIWRDEFQANTVDLDRWSFEKNCQGGGNNEAQCYVDEEKNVWVDGEYLHIRAIQENVLGPAVHDDDPNYDPQDQSGRGDYSSGRLRTRDKGDWRYGRFEIRAKLPSGQGTWPAIWMLPSDWRYGGWAASGEIDIMEAVNLKVGGERRIHGTLHYGGQWPDNVYSGAAYELPGAANPADDFHQYAVEWEEGEIRWYVDGDHFATQTQQGWYSTGALADPAAPFNQRFHLIVNLAVGGDWAGQVNDTGIDPSAFPQELVIDYVRVYECTKDPETGRGCATSDGDFEAVPGHTPPQPNTDPTATGDIFVDSVIEPYEWLFWAAEGSVQYQSVAVEGRGQVAQMNFMSENGIGYFQSAGAADFSGFDAVEFDLRVIADPQTSRSSLVFRADCGYPCTSGDYSIPYPGLQTWQHYRIPLAELATAGLNLSQVNTPFVISPTSANQQGVVIQVDNVRVVSD